MMEDMALWSLWWVWLAAALILAIVEVLAPGFIFLGFAIGVALTGLGIAVGLVGGSLPVLILVAAVLSLVAWLVLRRVVGLRKGQVKVWDRDVNEEP